MLPNSFLWAMFRKKKSVKKETQKPQNRYDDEDQLENIEVQQKLKKARDCSRGCTVVVSRTNEDFKFLSWKS